MSVLLSFLLTLRTWARSRAALQLEVLALRHQLQVLHRSRHRRVRLAKTDRWLWVLLSRLWTEWRLALVIVKPETVIAWHRRGFRLWWTWKSRCRMGRPTVPTDIRTLIRTMAEANPRWGAPRIHGELLKLGVVVSERTVSRCLKDQPRDRASMPSWLAFLRNHREAIAAMDLFTHSAFRGQTPDEMYLGTGDAMPADLMARATAVRRTRIEANRSASCATCPSVDQAA